VPYDGVFSIRTAAGVIPLRQKRFPGRIHDIRKLLNVLIISVNYCFLSLSVEHSYMKDQPPIDGELCLMAMIASEHEVGESLATVLF
jgi:hypothetical protein